MEGGNAVNLREHYEVVAQDTLRVLWRRKWLIAATVAAALVIAVFALMRMGPRYTSEAIVQMSFSHDDPAGATKGQPIAAMDAASLVDSAARIIRSRTTASSVVERLGLNEDERFTRQSVLSRALWSARSKLGLERTAPTPRDLAVNGLLARLRVTNDPRSYVISVAATATDPEEAARLANAVAAEYLRSRARQELDEARAATERELADVSQVYGGRHPTYQRVQARLQQLTARMSTLQDETSEDDVAKFAAAGALLAADKATVVAGPNVVLILGLTVGGALLAGMWLARITHRASARSLAAAEIMGTSPRAEPRAGLGVRPAAPLP